MTKSEKRLVCFAIFLVIFAFSTHWISGSIAKADFKIADSKKNTTANTATHSFTINRENAEVGWKILREQYSEVATASILGNLQYESGLYPYRLSGITPETSKKIIDVYKNSKSKFIYMDYAYGLAGWTGTTNLTRLWEWCEDNGYEIDSLEGQYRFLLEDYPLLAEMSSKRMQYYKTDEILYCVEDFRQSYEKSIYHEQSIFGRGKYAKLIFESFCEDIYDILIISKATNGDIYLKVKEYNERIAKEECILGE